MSPLCSCGKFHEPCAADRRLTAIAAAMRADPRVVVARAVTEAALASYQAGRGLPLKEWEELGKVWRASIVHSDGVSGVVWAEKREEYDR